MALLFGPNLPADHATPEENYYQSLKERSIVMKRLLILLIGVAFVVGVLGISSSIAQTTTPNQNEACKACMEDPYCPFEKLGECISFDNKQGVTMCKEFGEVFGFKNVGECVSFLNSSPVEMCQMEVEDPPDSGLYVPFWYAAGYKNLGQCIYPHD